jgi:hypothetical protein
MVRGPYARDEDHALFRFMGDFVGASWCGHCLIRHKYLILLGAAGQD